MSSLPTLTEEYILTNPSESLICKDLTVAEYMIEKIKEFGDSKALINSLTSEAVSYNDLIKETVKVAEGLKSLGVKPGDVIAICCENRLEYASVLLGILATGATCAPLNPLYNIGEFLHTLSISKPSIIFTSPLVIGKIQECQSQLPFIKQIIGFNLIEPNPKLISFEELIKNTGALDCFEFPKINSEEAVAFLFCSSGTTGLPKCVELTHANFFCVLNFVGTIWQTDQQKKVTLGLIPFFHGFGCIILMESIICETLNIVMTKFDEENFLNSIQTYKITHLFIVPPLAVFLSKHPLVTKYDLSSIRKMYCGAAPLSRNTEEAVKERLKLQFNIQQGYGMTELSICCVAFQKDIEKIGSSGTLAPGMECKIVDLETGKALPPYKTGELCFKGPFIMKGYRNDIQATKETFDSEGWFHTGDIAYYDSDGFLFIVDRLKELIKYKGFQVPPAELETHLINHPKIKEAGVVGIPDEIAGELPLAFVVLQPGAEMTEKEIQDYIADKVSPQKRLHGGVKFLEEIPKNSSGKILRKELRALAEKSKM